MQEIKYTLKQRALQKTLRMYFSDKGELIVSAPLSASKEEIEEFVYSRTDWIERVAKKYQQHTFLFGDKIRLFGVDYLLLVGKGKMNAVYLQDDKLIISTKREPETKTVKKLLFQYCKDLLEKKVRTKTEYWAEKMGRQKPLVEICNSKSRWGVCYPMRNLIRFSVVAITLPEELLDMIVVHEMCHFFYPNHGQAFKNLLAKWVPDIKEKEKILKQTDLEGWHKNLF